MPDRRRSAQNVPTATDRRKDAGQRLKRALHVARARAGMTSDVQVSVAAHVGYDTLMNWYGGRTIPRPFELRKVADALDVSYAEVWAVYEGVEPEPLPLQDSVRDLVAALNDLVLELRLSRAEQIVLLEQVQEARTLANGLSRDSTAPKSRARRSAER